MQNKTEAFQRVLVVDDNQDAAEMLGMLIEMLGNQVRSANNGADALSIAEDFAPQVVILDLGMPGMDGFETARKIRAAPWGKNLLLVALSGWGQEDDKRQTKAAGFDHHLVKPADLADLQQVLGCGQSA